MLLFVDPSAEASNTAGDVVAALRERLEPSGISVLMPSAAQDTNQFVANPETAERFGLTSMSSLVGVADQLTVGAPPECPQRPFCLAGLRRVYGLLFNDFVPLDVGGPQTIAALQNDEVQIALLFSTDPRIDANGFVRLVDDLRLQDAENITPVIRAEELNAQVRHALVGVSVSLSSEDVTELVGEIVIEGRDIPSVAREFLVANDLV